GARLGVPRRRHGAKAAEEGQILIRDRDRPPAQLPDRQIALLARRRRRAHELLVDFAVAGRMLHRWADAVEPGALVAVLRRAERRAGELLGVQAVFDLLGRI